MPEVKLEEAIANAWANLRDRVESKRDLDFDHEFTLQFHFAWEVARLFNFSDSLKVRFEVLCGKDSVPQVGVAFCNMTLRYLRYTQLVPRLNMKIQPAFSSNFQLLEWCGSAL